MSKNVQGFDCKGITRQGDKYVVTGCRPIRKTTAATFDEGLDAAQHTRECKEACMNTATERTERTKGDVWREIVDGAKAMTEGATPEQQVSVFLSTPKGAELYREYGDAPNGEPVKQATEPELGGTAERAVNQLIEKKAATFMASDSSLTEAQAYVKVLTEFPEVYERYRKAQQVDRKRARG